MKKPQYLDVPCAQIRRIFTALTIGALILYGVLGGGASVAQGQTLSLVWSDEFNGASIDPTKWTFDIGNGAQAGNPGWGNNELEYYTSNSANAYVTNGFLHIHAQLQITNTSEGTFNYTSARMKTQGLFNKTYGRIEWRAQLPGGVGFWPALRSLGSNIDSIGWPGCGEIDVVENDGSDVYFEQGSIHSGTDATEVYNFTGGNSVTNFHIYDLDWMSNSITWSVDGVAYETQTSWGSSTGNPYPFPFNQPFFFLMNVAIGGDYLGNPSTNAINPSLPGDMVIDYIRVYDYITVSIAVQANPSNGGTVSGGGTYNIGTNVTVCASANASCSSFVNWTLNGNVVSTSPCYTFTATNTETLVANFTPLAYYTISTSSSPAGGGSTSGGGTVACGSNVTFCATASPCHRFVNWTDQNSNIVSALACYTFTATNTETLVANFVPTLSYYIITASGSPTAGGYADGGGIVACESTVTVCA
jgi:beta-glucanase (GH16 family)